MSGLIIAVIIGFIVLVAGAGLLISANTMSGSGAEIIGQIMTGMGGACLGISLFLSLICTYSLDTIIYEPKTITKTTDGITVISYKDADNVIKTITSDKAPIYLTDNTNIVVRQIMSKNHWHGVIQPSTVDICTKDLIAVE